MVSYKVVDRNQRTPLIGGYLTPLTLEQLTDPEEVLNRFPGREPVVLGDLNVDIDRLRNPWDQQVADLLEYFGLVELLGNLQQCLYYSHLQTLWQTLHPQVLKTF